MAKNSRLRWWEIVFLILGSPIWLSVLISVFAVVFSVYVSLWSAIISLWAVFVSLLASAFGLTAASFILLVLGRMFSGAAAFAVGLVCAGLSIFMFFVCKAATKGIIFLTKKVCLALKNCLIKKEVA
ncbi:MAG: hypothetical protein IKK77_04000 [Clostridia bacterium]|nr:hypothetical protein [Clostridia bacterium]